MKMNKQRNMVQIKEDTTEKVFNKQIKVIYLMKVQNNVHKHPYCMQGIILTQSKYQ